MPVAGRQVFYDLPKKLREGREKSEIALKFLEFVSLDFATHKHLTRIRASQINGCVYCICASICWNRIAITTCR
jgi:alkylhydroperoxidase family enzyme